MNRFRNNIKGIHAGAKGTTETFGHHPFVQRREDAADSLGEGWGGRPVDPDQIPLRRLSGWVRAARQGLVESVGMR